jgi:hypothetical protein
MMTGQALANPYAQMGQQPALAGLGMQGLFCLAFRGHGRAGNGAAGSRPSACAPVYLGAFVLGHMATRP